jgi:non-heme chloroperoxidase
VGAVTPLMLKTAANPGGLAIEAFDKIRVGVAADRSQSFKDLTTPFFGANRPGAKVSQGVRDAFWLLGMQGGLKNEFDVPTLIIHGDDDQIVPIGPSAHASSKLVKHAPPFGTVIWPLFRPLRAQLVLCQTHAPPAQRHDFVAPPAVKVVWR